jgi:NitT/TauT family transport system substrate-binding protein
MKHTALTRRTVIAGAAISAASLHINAAAGQETITVGAAATTSDAPLYIADRLGYFKDEGLAVQITNFRSAADMIPPLGTGQLLVGAGSASAGLYNAFLQGISIKIVADKASSPPGYGATKILVRTDHFESGRFKALADLKGFRFAMNAAGVSNTATLNVLLKSAGLRYSDVTTVNMPLPNHVAALANKAVDASASVEPAAAIAIQKGFARLVKSDDEVIPNHQIAVLLYSEKFAKNKDSGDRFMRGYIRAVRFYNGALHEGRLAGPNADKVIEILSTSTSIKDPAIYKLITPTGMNPDGRVNTQSLADDLAFYREQGLVKGTVDMDRLVDHSFADAAVKALGAYKR